MVKLLEKWKSRRNQSTAPPLTLAKAPTASRTRKLKNVGCRRHFELPAAMQGKRIRIHFGAVDHQAWVFVNGRYAGTHAGCSAAFQFETSGWIHTLPNPEVRDMHDYTSDPAQLRQKWMDCFTAPPEGPYPPIRYFKPAESKADLGVPFMVSEVGGIGWATEGGWGYGKGPKTYDEFYQRCQETIGAVLGRREGGIDFLCQDLNWEGLCSWAALFAIIRIPSVRPAGRTGCL